MKAMAKKAALGEGVLMIYRLILLTFIALIVFALSAVYYEYYIDIRTTEAGIMAKNVFNCLAPQGRLIDIPMESQNKILEYCGIKNVERFYVNVLISNSTGTVFHFQHGDSGLSWVKAVYTDATAAGQSKTYIPGYFKQDFNIRLNNSDGRMSVEVLTAHE